MPEPKPLSIGIDDFKRLIEGGYTYVDKSLFLLELLELNAAVTIIPRMRRFGKTLNMSMARYFFEKNKPSNAHLFKGLAIQRHPKAMRHQGKYPVVFLTLKDVKGTSWAAIGRHLRIVIAKEYERHRYLLQGDLLSREEKERFREVLAPTGAPIDDALQLLTNWLERYHRQQVVVLIDEYDAPIHAAHLNGCYKKVIEFMQVWLGGALKGNTSLKFAVVTGILRIAKESIFSGLNNDSPYTVLKPDFSSCFGLLEHEVQALLATYGLAHKREELRRWYNGYIIGNQSAVYNPWSVIKYIKAGGVVDTYWANTGGVAILEQQLLRCPPDIKSEFEELLRGGALTKPVDEGLTIPELETDPDSIWGLLLYSGYLTLAAIPDTFDVCSLRIPNEEVRHLYAKMITKWFRSGITLAKYQKLLLSLTTGDVAVFASLFERLVATSISTFDGSSEQMYHAFVLGLLAALGDRYLVQSNGESGDGRYDVMLIPHDVQALGVILEFKMAKNQRSMATTATGALRQIATQRYATILRARGVKRILALGLAFHGKRVVVKHKTG